MVEEESADTKHISVIGEYSRSDRSRICALGFSIGGNRLSNALSFM